MAVYVTDEQISELLAKALGWTPAEVAAAPGRYAAFYRDHAFQQAHTIDWPTLTVTSAHPADALVYARGDFDLEQSVLSWVRVRTGDVSLGEFMAANDGCLFGRQYLTLQAAGRARPTLGQLYSVLGRLRGGDSLVEAGRALFMLQPDSPTLSPGAHGAVDPAWAEALAGFDAATRDHLGLFFQTPQAARGSGGMAQDAQPDLNTQLTACLNMLVEGIEVLATWWLGEGQGEAMIVRLPPEHIAPVPVFAGNTLLEKPARDRRPVPLTHRDTPADLLAPYAPMHRFFTRVVTALKAQPLLEVMRELAAEGLVLQTANYGAQLSQRDDEHGALVLLDGIAPWAEGADVVFVETVRAGALLALNHFAPGLEALERAIEAAERHGSPHIPRVVLYRDGAWAAWASGALDQAEAFIQQALALDAESPVVRSHLAAIRLLQGDEAGARAALDAAMGAGHDPDWPPALAEHAIYRELALRHAIPVEAAPS